MTSKIHHNAAADHCLEAVNLATEEFEVAIEGPVYCSSCEPGRVAPRAPRAPDFCEGIRTLDDLFWGRHHSIRSSTRSFGATAVRGAITVEMFHVCSAVSQTTARRDRRRLERAGTFFS